MWKWNLVSEKKKDRMSSWVGTSSLEDWYTEWKGENDGWLEEELVKLWGIEMKRWESWEKLRELRETIEKRREIEELMREWGRVGEIVRKSWEKLRADERMRPVGGRVVVAGFTTSCLLLIIGKNLRSTVPIRVLKCHFLTRLFFTTISCLLLIIGKN